VKPDLVRVYHRWNFEVTYEKCNTSMNYDLTLDDLTFLFVRYFLQPDIKKLLVGENKKYIIRYIPSIYPICKKQPYIKYYDSKLNGWESLPVNLSIQTRLDGGIPPSFPLVQTDLCNNNNNNTSLPLQSNSHAPTTLAELYKCMTNDTVFKTITTPHRCARLSRNKDTYTLFSCNEFGIISEPLNDCRNNFFDENEINTKDLEAFPSTAPQCSRNHVMQRNDSKIASSWFCNHCQTDYQYQDRWVCSRDGCDYDICLACAQQLNKKRKTEPMREHA